MGVLMQTLHFGIRLLPGVQQLATYPHLRQLSHNFLHLFLLPPLLRIVCTGRCCRVAITTATITSTAANHSHA